MSEGRTWYYAENGEQRGPYGADEMAAFLRQGALAAQTLVWNPSLIDWAPLRETSLGALLADAPAAPPPPPPPAAASGSVPSVGGPSLAKGPSAGPPFAEAEPARDDADLSMWEYFRRAVLRDYTRFEGRARRKEYWSYALVSFLIIMGASIVAGVLFGEGFGNLVNGLLSLAFLLPGLAALVRRLHDGGYSGWLALLLLIPFLGLVAVIVLTVLPSEPRANRFGPVPAGVATA